MAKKAKKETENPEAEANPEAGDAPEGEGEGAPKKGKKKLLIIIVAVLLLGGGAAAFFLMGSGGEEAPKAEEEAKHGEGDEHAKEASAKPVYYELPEFLVNLSSTGNRPSFLKMSVTLELRDKAAAAIVKANKPRILDSFNTYLRELRPTDVQGSAGMYRLREELLTRINGTIDEGLVKDILFSQIIVQ